MPFHVGLNGKISRNCVLTSTASDNVLPSLARMSALSFPSIPLCPFTFTNSSLMFLFLTKLHKFLTILLLFFLIHFFLFVILHQEIFLGVRLHKVTQPS